MVATVSFNGLSLDVDPYHIVTIEGLADLPDIRSGDIDRVARDGLVSGLDVYGGRTVTITIDVVADDQTAFGAAMSALSAAFAGPAANPLPLSFTIPGVADGIAARLYVKPRKRTVPLPSSWFNNLSEAVVQLAAADPLLYSEVEASATLEGATVSVGRTYSRTYTMVYGASGHPGTVLVENFGTATAPLTLTINGPVTNPTIRNVTTGQTLSLTVGLLAGETVTLNTADRTVLLGGTADRYSWLTLPGWFGLVPGINEIQYTALDPSTSFVQIAYRSAWI